MNVELRYVIHYCFLRKMKGDEILIEMQMAYGRNAPSRSSIFLWLSKFKNGKTDVDDEPRDGRPKFQENSIAIIDALDKEPYASTYRLEELTNSPQSTIWCILTSELHYKLSFCKWIPYKISDDIRQKRVEIAHSMLQVLTSEKISRMDIVTGDESWFYWSYEQTQIWLPENSERPQIPKPTIGLQKTLFSIYFSLRGIILIDNLEPKAKFNATYFVEQILPKIDSFYREFRPKNGAKNVFLHVDNARPHNAKISRFKMSEYGLKRMEHPPYSPDLAPCDFWLFGYIKEKLKGSHFTSQNELKNAICQILANISKEEISSVYDEWIARLNTVIEKGGDYI